MPAFKRRYRRKRRPYSRRSSAYKKRRNFRRGRKRSYRRLKRTSLKRQAMVRKTFVWRPVGAIQSFTPGLLAKAWGSAPQTMTFQMDQIAGYQELMNIWNYYKFCKAVWMLHIPGSGSVEMGQYAVAPPGGSLTAGYSGPFVGSYIDPDGKNTVLNLATLQEEPSYQIWHMRPGMRRKRVWKPTFLVPAYRSATTQSWRAKKGYITQSYLDIPHFGVVWDWQQGLTGSINIPVYWQVWVLIGLKQVDMGRPILIT